MRRLVHVAVLSFVLAAVTALPTDAATIRVEAESLPAPTGCWSVTSWAPLSGGMARTCGYDPNKPLNWTVAVASGQTATLRLYGYRDAVPRGFSVSLDGASATKGILVGLPAPSALFFTSPALSPGIHSISLAWANSAGSFSFDYYELVSNDTSPVTTTTVPPPPTTTTTLPPPPPTTTTLPPPPPTTTTTTTLPPPPPTTTTLPPPPPTTTTTTTLPPPPPTTTTTTTTTTLPPPPPTTTTTTTLPPPPPPGGTVYAVPGSIAADCSAPVESQLNAFIASVPDNSLIQFPAGACYAQANRIEVRDKTNVTIDGQGSTFRSSAPNDGSRLNPNWLLLRGHNVTVENLTAVGNFNLTGPRSQARANAADVSNPPTGNQFNAGLFIYGGDGVYITDVKAQNVFGDGIGTAISEYVEGSGAPYESPRNVHILRFEATTTARHCFSPSSVEGLWIQDSVGRDCWYGGMDLELDDKDTHTLRDIHILHNTFDGFFMFGIAVPVAGAGDNTRDIEISNNTFLTPADNACNQIILVGIYPSNPYTFKNVVVAGNGIKYVSGTAIAYDHVEGGAIRDNTITQVPPPGYTTVQPAYCATPGQWPITITNSTGVADTGNTVVG